MVLSTESQQTTVNGDDETFSLDESGQTRLPVVEVLTGRGFVTGKSGSGKSNSASVIAEELLGRGFPLLVVDTDGEYWGLKEEYEILHVGADEECDLQVGPEHAQKLAELALDQNVPIILDVSGYLDEEDANDLIRQTAHHLFAKEKKLKKPFLMLVEEVHEYIPEGAGLDETGQMLVKIGKRGRKHGLGLVGISQRPADVKKDFITQANWLLWHRLTWENDTQVVRRVVDSDHADMVSDLGDGEAFLQADFLDEDVQRVQVRRKETFDAGATPGLDDFERPDLKSVSGDLVGELEEISEREERRQDRISQLEHRLEEKQERIEELEAELENARDLSNMAEQFTQAMMTQESGGDGGAATEQVNELVEEKNDLQRELEAERERRETAAQRVQELEQELERRPEPDALETVEEATERLAEALNITGDGQAEKWRQKARQLQERVEELEAEAEEEAPETEVLEHPAVQRQLGKLKDTVRDLGDKQLKMLEWFDFYGPGEVGDAYFHAGYKRSSGRRHEAAQPLKDADVIRKEGKGVYRYALDEKVREQFEDNPQIGEEDIEALIAEVEQEFQDAVEEIDDS